MANLDETVADWPPGVYQIEQSDPVLGGAPNESTGAGLTNIPNQQLAKRTNWLKARVDTLVGLVVAATTSVAGIVKLYDGTDSSATTIAATANAVKAANDNANTRALKTTQVAAAGLATGGGDLSATRTITVPAASQAQAQAGTDNATAMTPLRVAQAIAALVGVTVSFGAPGYIKIAGLIIQWGSTAAADANGLAVGTLPTAFTTAVYMAISGENSSASGASGNVIITGWLPDATTLTQIAFRTAKPTSGTAVSEAVNYIVIGK